MAGVFRLRIPALRANAALKMTEKALRGLNQRFP